MARIVVLGAGVCGLAAGMLLSRDGHEVVVLERDADGVPGSADEAWKEWSRDGVAQFRQPHFLHARGRIVLEPGGEPSPSTRLRRGLLAAVARDPDAFRTYVASRCCLTSLGEAFTDQDFVARIMELARDSTPPPLPGPDRAQLLSLLG